ncbi:hypothetical protein DPMN_118878 [Dreissena polymorpha]|uniref:Uncharacterized protein n=1 Tax=Dreissena polymorpha TaxID=45954 RepID=A0A9D4GHU1_DREPO|nr:hypothetical protein DPMN_118878 [Dreissena polymorpha]
MLLNPSVNEDCYTFPTKSTRSTSTYGTFRPQEPLMATIIRQKLLGLNTSSCMTLCKTVLQGTL